MKKEVSKSHQLKPGTNMLNAFQRKSRKKAFTITELMIVLFCSTLVVLAGYGIYIMNIKSYRKGSEKAELTQNARVALERLSREIRQSNEIISVLPDTDDGTAPSEIKFQDGHNFWSSSDTIQYITYYLDGTNLHRKLSHYSFPATPDEWVLWTTKDSSNNSPEEHTDLDQVKAEYVSGLKFWGTNPITINVVVTNNNNSFTFETKSLARNVQ